MCVCQRYESTNSLYRGSSNGDEDEDRPMGPTDQGTQDDDGHGVQMYDEEEDEVEIDDMPQRQGENKEGHTGGMRIHSVYA